MRYHLTPVRMAITKIYKHCWRWCVEENPLILLVGIKLVQLLWRTAWRFLKKLKKKKKTKNRVARDPEIPLLDIYLDKTIIKKDTCSLMFTEALFTIAQTWKQSKCPSTEEWIKKMWHTYNGIWFSHKKQKVMPLAATCMQFEIILLSEVNHKEKVKHSMKLLTCGI